MKQRRLGARQSKTRVCLIKAAEEIIHDEGYAAVSARSVAARANLKPALIHYYFLNMDDLYLEVFRYTADKFRKRYEEALRSPYPLKEIWNLNNDPYNAATLQEYLALANHRSSLRREIVDGTVGFRRQQLADISRTLRREGTHPDAVLALIMLMQASSITLITEANLGIHIGHAELRDFVERQVDIFEKNSNSAKALTKASRRKRSCALPSKAGISKAEAGPELSMRKPPAFKAGGRKASKKRSA